MLFESCKGHEIEVLEVGDIIEWDGPTKKQRRLIVTDTEYYRAINISDMTQGNIRATLDNLLDVYKYKKNFRIIKSKNLKIVEVE